MKSCTFNYDILPSESIAKKFLSIKISSSISVIICMRSLSFLACKLRMYSFKNWTIDFQFAMMFNNDRYCDGVHLTSMVWWRWKFGMLFSAQNFSFASLTVCLLKKVANLLTSLLSHLHEGHWGSNFCCANPLTPTFLWTSSKKKWCNY